jgi:transposase-like protein
MSKKNTKRYTPEFKARVALEAAQEQESLAQIGHRYVVHPVLVGQWKKKLPQEGFDEHDVERDRHRRTRRSHGRAQLLDAAARRGRGNAASWLSAARTGAPSPSPSTA